MAVTPSGILSKPLENCRTLLANVAEVQTFLGAADADAALAKIYPEFASPDTSRPFICVYYEDGQYAFGRRAEGQWLPDSGNSLTILFERDVSAAYQDVNGESDATRDQKRIDAFYEFANLVGPAIDGIAENAGVGTYFNITQLSLVSGPARAGHEDKTGRGDYYQCIWRAEWD